MANSAYRRKKLSVAYTLTGAPAVVEHFTVKSGQSFAAGEPVIFSSGELQRAAATSGTILGVALEDGTAGEKCAVAVADRNTVFMGLTDGTSASFTLGVLTECDLAVANTSEWNINPDAVVEGVLQLVGPVPNEELDDATNGALYYFQIKRSAWDGLVAAK